jgi:hypothetical protein
MSIAPPAINQSRQSHSFAHLAGSEAAVAGQYVLVRRQVEQGGVAQAVPPGGGSIATAGAASPKCLLLGHKAALGICSSGVWQPVVAVGHCCSMRCLPKPCDPNTQLARHSACLRWRHWRCSPYPHHASCRSAPAAPPRTCTRGSRQARGKGRLVESESCSELTHPLVSTLQLQPNRPAGNLGLASAHL